MHPFTIQTFELSGCSAELHHTRQTRWNRPMNITMYCAVVMAGFTAAQSLHRTQSSDQWEHVIHRTLDEQQRVQAWQQDEQRVLRHEEQAPKRPRSSTEPWHHKHASSSCKQESAGTTVRKNEVI